MTFMFWLVCEGSNIDRDVFEQGKEERQKNNGATLCLASLLHEDGGQRMCARAPELWC